MKANKKYKVVCKDTNNDKITLTIYDDKTVDITGDKFTTKMDALEIKNSLDSIMSFTEMLDKFELNSIEIERE